MNKDDDGTGQDQDILVRNPDMRQSFAVPTHRVKDQSASLRRIESYLGSRTYTERD